MKSKRGKSKTAAKTECIFEGIGVSAGIAVGSAYVREQGSVEVREYCVAPEYAPQELERFHDAVGRTRHQLEHLKTKVK